MSKKEKNINLMVKAIKDGELSNVKRLVKQGIDIHYGDDYFLYIAVFEDHKELQKYFIDIGLDPEVTAGRMAVAHPKGLEYIRKYKHEKETKEFAEELGCELQNNNIQEKKLKI